MCWQEIAEYFGDIRYGARKLHVVNFETDRQGIISLWNIA